MTVDEVLINGRRYRVPEKAIMLDFWNKVGRGNSQYDEYVILGCHWYGKRSQPNADVQMQQVPCRLL